MHINALWRRIKLLFLKTDWPAIVESSSNENFSNTESRTAMQNVDTIVGYCFKITFYFNSFKYLNFCKILTAMLQQNFILAITICNEI